MDRRVVFIIVVVNGLLICCRQKESDPTATNSSPIAMVADSTARQKSDSIFFAAEVARKKGDDKTSLTLHQQALDIRRQLNPKSAQTAYSLWKTGQLQLVQFRLSEANENLESARALAEMLSFPRDTLVLMLLNAAATKRELNDFPSSQSLAIRALALTRDALAPNANLMSRCYRSLASSYYANKQFQEAIENFQLAITLADPASDGSLLASLYFNVALCYGGLKDLKKELLVLDKAKSVLIRSFGGNHPLMGGVFLNKGEIFRTMGQLDSAMHYFKANLAFRKRMVGEKDFATAGAKESLGNFFAGIGQLDSALMYYHGSLISAVPSFSNSDVFENPSLKLDEVTKDLVPFLVSKAIILERIYQRDTRHIEVLEKSFETLLLADSIFNVIRTNLTYDDPQLAQLTDGGLPYDLLLTVANRLYAVRGSEKYVEHAFRIMERSRAVVLKDALNRAEFYSQVGVSEEMKQRENKLRETRASLVNLFSKTERQTQRDSVAELLLKNDREFRQLQADIAEVNPSYFQVRFGSDAPTLRGLKDLMKEKESTWIEFFWGERILTILRVDAKDVLLKQIPVDSALSASVKYLRQELTASSTGSFRKEQFKQFVSTLHYLHTVLLMPLLTNGTTKKLVISADGPLSLFPFEILIREQPESDEVDYHLPYLVNSYFFSYHYSAMQLLKQHTKERHGDKLLALGYAGSGKGPIRRNAFNDLPGTREEVLAIRRVMTNRSNQYLLERDASESAFKAKISEFDLVHLAIHGVGDTLDAMQSRLVFRSEGDSLEDGQLFTHELYGLNLEELDLAVLSACESGVGKHQAGEGAMSIARGFAYAGCPTLVISLWKINDKTVPSIMATFYQNVAEQVDIDEALTEAKRRYLENSNEINSHPANWAAFLAVGETKAIANDFKARYLLFAFAIIISLGGVILVVKRKRSARVN